MLGFILQKSSNKINLQCQYHCCGHYYVSNIMKREPWTISRPIHFQCYVTGAKRHTSHLFFFSICD